MAFIKGAGLTLVGAMGTLLVAVALVWPLWYLATKKTALYTVLAFSALGLWLVFRAVRGIVNKRSVRSLPFGAKARASSAANGAGLFAPSEGLEKEDSPGDPNRP